MKKTLMTPNGSYDNKNERLKSYKYRRIFVVGFRGALIFQNYFFTSSAARRFLTQFCIGTLSNVEDFDILSFEVRV